MRASLTAWRQALAFRSIEPVRVVCIGSSTTAGLNATAPDRRYSTALGHAIRARLGATGGTYLRGIDTAWSTTGTTTDVGRGLGLHSRSLAVGATMTTPSATCSGWTIYFEQGGTSGAFTYAIDGGSATTVTPDTTNSQIRHDGSVYVSAGSLGAHTLTITATAATVISGVYTHVNDQTSGVQVFNSGSSGTSSADWTGTGSPFLTHLSRISALDPALLIIMIGSNDSTGVDPALYRERVREQVLKTRAACPTATSVLLVHSFGRLDLPNPPWPWAAYGRALTDLAKDLPDTDVLDLTAHYPTSQINDTADLLSSDGIHASDRGHALLAELVATHLTTSSPASTPSSAGLRAASTPGTDPAALPGLVSAWRSSDLPNSAASALPSWAPYAGVQSAPLAQATGAKQPSVVASAFGAGTTIPVVRFSAAAAQVMQTAAWSQQYPVPLTILLVAKPSSTNYTLFSGTSGAFVYLGQSATPEMMVLGAGAASEAQVFTGQGRWRALGVAFNGANTLFAAHDIAPVVVTTGTSSAAKLGQFTLNGNSSGSLNGNVDVAEVLVFDRALTERQLTAALDVLAARYGLTTPSPSSAPVVPTSGTPVPNTSSGPVTVAVSGGTVTDIVIGGRSTALTGGTITLPAGSTIALIYTGPAPTWRWSS
ncbi:SGNH/GDSL hydrolase family protein [Actinosynnema mirum]|uniref:Lipolytic protein G-D-S-L family n=1 Tax=Actinosynnema mirum (strain ATCC 29888 / DSM 43827 / JCM 3225 / NBRC 14064 / NCIMB 13271 / NRRL B-12336 / IMRU 3971 / 101) TaxID=446462 RepID=C6WBM0_ACTMD|nr:SGNH/GDSL hydrolase family protein [Actinosynnema mirum]ACU35588.1 lipolytic protein G-D-S-L family [Actinosynnema mirum DSM 43827]